MIDDLETGFDLPTPTSRADRRRGAVASLAASLALTVGTIVAVTAVSIGYARADTLQTVLNNEGAVFGIALLLGALFIASTVTKAVAPRRHHTREYRPRHR